LLSVFSVSSCSKKISGLSSCIYGSSSTEVIFESSLGKSDQTNNDTVSRFSEIGVPQLPPQRFDSAMLHRPWRIQCADIDSAKQALFTPHLRKWRNLAQRTSYNSSQCCLTNRSRDLSA
jgi:hypothetical protein